MNHNIHKLYNLASKPNRLIIGLMSGTSIDGLDVALCSFEGSGPDTKVKLIQFETVAFNAEMKAEVKSVFSSHSSWVNTGLRAVKIPSN